MEPEYPEPENDEQPSDSEVEEAILAFEEASEEIETEGPA